MPDPCAECGSETRISKGSNRFRSYRGQLGFVIPEELEFDACDKCGARWMTDAQLDILSDSLEAQRKARMPIVKFKKLNPKAHIPQYQTPGAAAMDLRACLDDPVWLAPGERKLIPTGLSLEIPVGFEGQVRPRSGMALKQGIGCVNSPGTIDSDYRGELGVILINHGQTNVTIEDGDRIAQMTISPVAHAEVIEVDELDESARGGGGFGSTGRR